MPQLPSLTSNPFLTDWLVERAFDSSPVANRNREESKSYSSDKADIELCRLLLSEYLNKPEYYDDHDKWLMVGFALKSEAEKEPDADKNLFQIWDEWSQHSLKYQDGECHDKWDRAFNKNQKGITLGTLVYWAKEEGYEPPRKRYIQEDIENKPLPLIFRNIASYVEERGRGKKKRQVFNAKSCAVDFIMDSHDVPLVREFVHTGQVWMMDQELIDSEFFRNNGGDKDWTFIWKNVKRKGLERLLERCLLSLKNIGLTIEDTGASIAKEIITLVSEINPDAVTIEEKADRMVFKNGVLDFSEPENIKFKDGFEAQDYILNKHDFPLESTELGAIEDDCPNVWRFLLEVMSGEPKRAKFLVALLAAMLRGLLPKLQKFVFLRGKGGNGKGIFQRLAEKLFPPGTTASFTKLEQLEGNHETQKLVGKRLLILDDVPRGSGSTTGVASLKVVTGGGMLSINPKFEKPYEIEPSFSIIMSSNYAQFVGEAQESIGRRKIEIHFKEDFTSSGFEAKDILASFDEEIPKLILHLASLPYEEIRAAIYTYEDETDLEGRLEDLRKDHVFEFIENCLTRSSDSIITLSPSFSNQLNSYTFTHKGEKYKFFPIFLLYQRWCKEQGIKKALSNNQLNGALKNLLEEERLVKKVYPNTPEPKLYGQLEGEQEKKQIRNCWIGLQVVSGLYEKYKSYHYW